MKKLRNFLKNNQGVVLIEFAFILPILLLLTFPMIDYARYVLLQQKVIKTAYVLGDAFTISNPIEADTDATDIATDGTRLTEAVFAELLGTVPQLMLPFREELGENLWQVVVSYVLRPAGGTPQLIWQYDEDSDSFNSGAPSNIGSVAAFNSPVNATLPIDLVSGIGDDEGFIVVEVTGRHEPITPILSALGIPFVSATDVRYTSYMRTRYGDLQYIWSNNCPPTSTVCP